ncbi:MAG: single-stranded DNA-binding protein [Cellulomonadaceae bacterium]|jgi:single-strand DNA-binding protein|nr:single-stranded DNA-binding protein [Cellulomonadaceae bacterium]
MNGVSVTVTGYVGSDPSLMTAKSGITWTQFRVGSTRRWRDNEGKWVDGPTMWFTVKCWEGKAKNIAESLRKGVPVVVTGRLCEEPYVITRSVEGGEPITELRNSLSIENAIVGVDLARGVAHYTRSERDLAEPSGVPNWLLGKRDAENDTPQFAAVSGPGLEQFEESDEMEPEEMYAMA